MAEEMVVHRRRHGDPVLNQELRLRLQTRIPADPTTKVQDLNALSQPEVTTSLIVQLRFGVLFFLCLVLIRCYQVNFLRKGYQLCKVRL
ncbi:hypothetical protein HanIR_Chr02g0081001 [Helianthus annuus]|nr:hypothetical protein HanIR_Chr02g0081001 [Helianthus annuus]